MTLTVTTGYTVRLSQITEWYVVRRDSGHVRHVVTIAVGVDTDDTNSVTYCDPRECATPSLWVD